MTFEKWMELILGIVSLVLSGFLIPYLQNKWGNEKLKKVASWVKIAVTAAEQIYNESGMGKKKKAFVIEYLNKKKVNINAEELNALIESAVYEMNTIAENLLKEETKV